MCHVCLLYTYSSPNKGFCRLYKGLRVILRYAGYIKMCGLYKDVSEFHEFRSNFKCVTVSKPHDKVFKHISFFSRITRGLITRN